MNLPTFNLRSKVSLTYDEHHEESRRAQREADWWLTIGALLMGLWILLFPALGIYYLFGAGAIVWGVMKASRAEGPVGMGFARCRRRPGRAQPSTTDDAADPLDVDGAEAESDRPND